MLSSYFVVRYKAMTTKLALFFFLSSASFAAERPVDLTHPFYLLSKGEFTVEAKAGLFMEEFEFEKAKVVQDLFEYEHNFYHLGSIIGFSGNRQIGLEASFNDRGDLDKTYSPTLNLQTQNVAYKGFHALEVFFQQHFETDSEKNKLAFEVRTKGSPFKGKETNNTYSGKDIGFNLRYSHLHSDDWRIYGSIHAEVVGKKKIRKYDGELEVTSPYSEFGSLIGVQWLMGKFWMDLNGLFYLTTDYNTISSSYSRLTDKGFIIGGRFQMGYRLGPKTIVTATHQRQGSNFNVITEDTSQETEFEIETQFSQLGVTWLF